MKYSKLIIKNIQIIDIKTVPKIGKTNIMNKYTHQLENYIKDKIPLIEDLKLDNPNKKPLREGSKFIPLKKKR